MAEPKIGRKCSALTRPHFQRRGKERMDSGTDAAGSSRRCFQGSAWDLVASTVWGHSECLWLQANSSHPKRLENPAMGPGQKDQPHATHRPQQMPGPLQHARCIIIFNYNFATGVSNRESKDLK